MEYKPGNRTSEYNLVRLFSGVLASIGALLVFYGVATEQEVALWTALILQVLAAAPVIVYTLARTWYKARAEFESE